MAGANVRGMLKLNAKKIADAPRAFFFAADKGQDPVLYIDKKFDNPKRFGNLKKITQISSSLFSVDLSKKAKICVGTVVRVDGTLQFTPMIQKSNATALKKGIKSYRKELGPAQVVLGEEESTASAAITLAVVIGALRTFSKARKTDDPQTPDFAQTGIEAIDNYVAGKIGGDEDADPDAILNGESIKGKTLAEWRAELESFQSADDEFDITETIAELQAQQEEARQELTRQQNLFKELSASVDKGTAVVVDGILSRSLVSLVKTGDINVESISDKMGKSIDKLDRLVKRQDGQRDLLLDTSLQSEEINAKLELKTALVQLEESSSSGEDVTGLQEQVSSGKLRLEHVQVQQTVQKLQGEVVVLQQKVDDLEDEVIDTTMSTAVVGIVQGGLDTDTLKNALADVTARLDTAVDELEAKVNELDDAKERSRLLGELRNLSVSLPGLRKSGQAALDILGDEDRADEHEAANATLLNVRIEIEQDLAKLAELRKLLTPSSDDT